MESLPTFKYFPDPVAHGSIVRSDTTCRCCGQKRGFIFAGLPYCEEDLPSCICPWCIADGSADAKFDAAFTDEDGIGGNGRWTSVPQAVIEEVAYRTPGFNGWQQEEWWTHCGDAGAFLATAGAAEIAQYGPQLEESLKNYIQFEPEEWQEFLATLEKDGSPMAYVFKCLHCGAVGGYWDCD